MSLLVAAVFAATDDTPTKKNASDATAKNVSSAAIGYLKMKGPKNNWLKAANVTSKATLVTAEQCSGNTTMPEQKYAWFKAEAKKSGKGNVTQGVCYATAAQPTTQDLETSKKIMSYFWFKFPGMNSSGSDAASDSESSGKDDKNSSSQIFLPGGGKPPKSETPK
ncbi:hypothetical protein O181_049792 [Austropuccinia psidii MF-1]|uniref:Uncharacterized protein n=1 Tax=Austropuccinia psidii MF-1 TaxID=1389203 RepID=A0A9Q3E2G7_9BASI|nr:hypothetical protein [Austropuccinia psidii MF-1]